MAIGNYYKKIKKQIKYIVGKENKGIDIVISGNKFKDLRISKKKDGSAVSKAGTLYWTAELDNNRVKIYDCKTEAQAILIQKLAEDPILKKYFPKCEMRINNILVVDWIEGTTLSWKIIEKNTNVFQDIVGLQVYLHKKNYECFKKSNLFDYINYQKNRLLKFKSILPIQNFIDKSFSILTEHKIIQTPKVSHPDITAANFIIENNSGLPKLIDNELLTQNNYNLFDLFNTIYSFGTNKKELLFKYLDLYIKIGGDINQIKENEGFYKSLWNVRLIGSLLESGYIKKAYRCYEQAEASDNLHPIFSYIKEKL